MSLRETVRPGRLAAVSTEPAPVSYRSVLAHREFRAVLLSQGLSVLGDQLARLALAVMVFRQTGSAFAASATYAVPMLTYLVAGPILSSLADRWSRRRIMVASDGVRVAFVVLLATPHLPLVAVFILLGLMGLATPAFESARAATLPDMLPGEAYPRGVALYNLVHQGSQVVGFLVGGALLAELSVSQVLLLDAATFTLSAVTLRFTLDARPATAASGFSLLRDTADGIRLVFTDPRLRRLLGFALLSAAAVAAPESVAVPVAKEMGGGALASGVLTASLPAGFLLASFAVLRVDTDRRERLLLPLAALTALPLMLTPLSSSLAVTAGLWVAGGMGSSMQLIANASYVVAAPIHARGRAYGMAAALLMAVQGISQLLVGALASVLTSRSAVALVAAGTLLLLSLLRGNRDSTLKKADRLVDGALDV